MSLNKILLVLIKTKRNLKKKNSKITPILVEILSNFFLVVHNLKKLKSILCIHLINSENIYPDDPNALLSCARKILLKKYIYFKKIDTENKLTYIDYVLETFL